MQSLNKTKLVCAFSCLGERCADTCCQNWSMQVDDATLARYRERAPELLAVVDSETDGFPVMKRDPQTRFCVKMEDGLCAIHKKFGDEMLGDACHFYPRITRNLLGENIMTVSSSCPEVMRLALELAHPFALEVSAAERLPSALKHYAPEGLSAAHALAVHQAFIACAMDETIAPEQALARISSVARSLPMLAAATLHEAVPAYLRMAAGRLPAAEKNPSDSFNLLHALCGLIVASHKPISARLKQTISDTEQALTCTLDWQQVTINLTPQSAESLTALQAHWAEQGAHYEHALRRFLALQLSMHLFPFAGLGGDAVERITFIGVRFATVKLALAAASLLHGELGEEEIIRVVQSLSRFLDHLGEAEFSLSIYRETGWIKETRLLGLVL